MNKISVIIVSYNSEKHIFECIQSIFNYNDIGESLEVIVVDNKSINSDEILLKIENKFGTKVKLVQNQANVGYGAGNNIGADISTGDILIFMNPDIRLVKPIFNIIVKRFENKDLGLLGVHIGDVGKESMALQFKPEYTLQFHKMLFQKQYIRCKAYKIEEVFFSGSFFVLNRDIFYKIGKFDENIFMYHEEADISNRILAAGKITEYAKDVNVLHLTHGRNVNRQLLKIGSESREYYFKKYNADIDKYYKNLVKIYKLKYFAATLLNNKIKKEEFKEWISLCKEKGKIN